ncbi:MAG: hypothetical protein H7Z74_09575 [Anaerolineae bacterium]|nr:hypothetical protein [Gemmatimonadaceae bacterium]
MARQNDTMFPDIAVLDAGELRIEVSLRVRADAIEYLGHLWFTEHDRPNSAITDRAVLPGRTEEEVFGFAKRLTAAELMQRYDRAVAEKRRYRSLRRVTDSILTRIRHLHRVALVQQAGLMDEEGAAEEIAAIEKQLHELVDDLRRSAGVAEEEEGEPVR